MYLNRDVTLTHAGFCVALRGWRWRDAFVQQRSQSSECLTQYRAEIGSRVAWGTAVHRDLPAGHGEIETDAERRGVRARHRQAFDAHVAGHDVIAFAGERGNVFADAGLYRGRGLEVMTCDANRCVVQWRVLAQNASVIVRVVLGGVMRGCTAICAEQPRGELARGSLRALESSRPAHED